MVDIEQIKGARAMLGFNQKELASKAGIAIATLNNIERGVQTDPKMSTMRAIEDALKDEGIEFLNDPIRGIGIYLKVRQSKTNPTILIVDDNRSDRALYRTWLQNDVEIEYNIIEAENAIEGFEAFVEHQPDCIILDFMMYGTDGFQLMARMRSEVKRVPPIVFVTGMHNDVMEENAFQQGVHMYLNKEMMTRSDLCQAVQGALGTTAQQRAS